ncbi:hypothetical protein CBM2609_A140001 [Cupriavidus taiwanensis]|nr:hypothetical protein CBM2604_A120001 [Cupriavidus taiwanensis]SOZ25276.1 hypothetical protein CBM2609_A140001 [Cupriavidus taiwanensis]SOZ44527.1 hypothetical protein CBM2610_A150001 [Cupriavidus taiwanensis]
MRASGRRRATLPLWVPRIPDVGVPPLRSKLVDISGRDMQQDHHKTHRNAEPVNATVR